MSFHLFQSEAAISFHLRQQSFSFLEKKSSIHENGRSLVMVSVEPIKILTSLCMSTLVDVQVPSTGMLEEKNKYLPSTDPVNSST